MTITHPDQVARIKEAERCGCMFPKGARQMVAYIYAMEGVPADTKNVHQKLIEMFGDGVLDDFPIDGVNMSGSDTLDRRAECAVLRCKVECFLDHTEVASFRAKFGLDVLLSTQRAIMALVSPVQEYLTSGRRRAQRSREYCGRLLWISTCSPKHQVGQFHVNLAREYGVRDNLFSRDLSAVKRFLSRQVDKGIGKVERNFKDPSVCPC